MAPGASKTIAKTVKIPSTSLRKATLSIHERAACRQPARKTTRPYERNDFPNTPEYPMKKFLSILASAAVLAMPLAVISTPAAAQTAAAAPAAPMAAPAAKAKHSKAVVKHKAKHAKVKAKAKMAPKAA